MSNWYKPLTVGQGVIKSRERDYVLIRNENFYGRTTPVVSWQVAQIMPNYDFRLAREFKTKRDATHWLYICAKV